MPNWVKGVLSYKKIIAAVFVVAGVGVAIYVQAMATAGTAEVDTDWVGGGSTTVFTFTYNNPGGGDPVVNVQILRPGNNFSLTAGSGSGWTVAVGAGAITFTDGSIAGGASETFTVTADAVDIYTALDSWTVNGKAAAGNYVSATSTGEGLDSGIDNVAPTGQGHYCEHCC